MTPPIRDGSGNSIGAIRLGDGTEISEVRTGAGDVLFSAALPDSAIAQYDATDGFGPGDDGNAITTWGDEIGTNDVSGGSPVVRENGINGKRALEFDESAEDVLSADIQTVAQPFTVLAAVDFSGDTSANRAIVGDLNTNQSVQYNSDDQWVAFFGSRLNGNSTQGTTVVGWVIDDADSASFEGSTTAAATGDAGGGSLDALQIGAENDPSDRFWDGLIGEVVLYSGDLRSTGELSPEINRLLGKWTNG